MGSLSNLYISQSYQSLLHFGNNTSASATLVEIQDGVGTGLGVYLNTTGSISASNTITTNNLVVNNSTELTGVFDLDTYFTASTPAYTNSTQPYFNDTVFVTGSYPLGGYPPSIADVAVGWIGNGINVTNGIVTAVSQSVSGYYITMAGQFPQISQSYRFTGRISQTAKITGSLEVSENLIVSGTFDIEGKVVVNDNVRINGNLEVSGSQRNTGSLFVSNEISSSTINGIGNVTQFSQSLYAEFTNLENYTSSLRAAFTASGTNTIFTNDITASNVEVRNNLNVVGTLTASKIVTLIESSSIIFSSGSNILGDDISDTQTLIGSVIVSGSGALTGSLGISNNLEVKGNISSSTVSGIGNVTTYSASVQTTINNVSSSISGTITNLSSSISGTITNLSSSISGTITDLSQSVSSSQNVQDARLNKIEISTGSLNTFSASVTSALVSIYQTTASLNTFTQSAQISINNLNSYTASFVNNYVTNTTFNSFTSSTNSRLTNIESTTASLLIETANLELFSASALTRLNALSAATASYATTGSNLFVGNQTITGSLIISSSAAIELNVIGNSTFSGSVRGRVVPLTITSLTASMDCSLGNFFTLTLANGVNTMLVPTNIQPGETISLLVTQNASSAGTLSYQNIKYQVNTPYTASLTLSSQDMLTFISYDSSNLYGAYIKNLV